MRTQARKEGYLLIDHSASPGLSPEDLLKAGLNPGLAVGEGQMLETATLTCAHCNGTVVKNPKRSRPRGHCSKCDSFVCDGCAALGECFPFSAVAENIVGSDKPFDPFLLSPLLRSEEHFRPDPSKGDSKP